MDVREEDVFPPAPDDVVQDKMLNWVIRGVTLDQSYKKEDYIPIKPDRFKGLQQFTYSAGAHPEAYPIDVYVYKLGGLEYATDLRKIDLSYNMVSDLTPLKDLTNLRDLTFYMNKLTSVKLPSHLVNIGEEAFADNKITEVTLPESAINVAANAFDKGVKINKTVKPSANEDGNKTVKPDNNKNNNKDKNTSAKTADEAPVIPFATTVVIACAVIMYVKNKKRSIR